MALVKIKDFKGSLTGNAVLETLQIIGVTDALNKRKYNLSLTGVQEPTPKGMIDDEPKCHVIKVDKVKFIGKRTVMAFMRGMVVDKTSDSYKQAISEMEKTDIKFGLTLGVSREEKRYITADKDGCWYRHSVEFKLEQGEKSAEEYVKYMFETIANMVVTSN